MSFAFSFGRNRYDAQPQQCEVPTLREFAASVLSHRARDKATAGYVSAAFSNDGRRNALNAAPRAWLPLDVDGIDPDAFVDWRLFLTRYRGFGWPTASSTPDAPRERVIIELSERVDRHRGMAIGTLLMRDIEDIFGSAVRIDPCTFRAEQPCFLPVGNVQPFYLLGDALDVEVWADQVPDAPAPPPPATAEVALIADARMRRVVDQMARAGLLQQPLANGKGYAVTCPWHRRHTTVDEPGSTATALLFPSEGNGWRGGFRCLHSHCARHDLRELTRVLAAAEKSMSHEAAHG